jgi:hypothetical protein
MHYYTDGIELLPREVLYLMIELWVWYLFAFALLLRLASDPTENSMPSDSVSLVTPAYSTRTKPLCYPIVQ